MLKYLLFFGRGLLYTFIVVFPFFMFVVIQDKLNAKFERNLLHTVFGKKSKQAKKSSLGILLIRYTAFAGIWLHEALLWLSAWVFGFIPSDFKSFNTQAKNAMTNTNNESLGYDSMATITLNYREFDVRGNIIKRVSNKFLFIVSKLFGAMPYLVAIFGIAWFFRYIIVHYTTSIKWMSWAAYFPNKPVIQQIPDFVNYLIWGYSEVLRSPILIVIIVALSFFFNYGLTMPKSEKNIVLQHIGVLLAIIYCAILLSMAQWIPVIGMCFRIGFGATLILSLILFAESAWTLVFQIVTLFTDRETEYSVDADDASPEPNDIPVGSGKHVTAQNIQFLKQQRRRGRM